MRAALVSEGVRIEVIDSGAGVKPEDLPYIFERFYSRDASHQRGWAKPGWVWRLLMLGLL